MFRSFRFTFLGLLGWVTLLCWPWAARADEPARVTIADPYIELHTGPGAGYPIFHVIDKGDEVEVLKRRTDWFKVRDDREHEGWVHRDQLARTLQPTGDPLEIPEPGIGDYSKRRWEMGVMGGGFGGASLLSAYLGYALSDNLSAELMLGHSVGDYSSNLLANLSLVNRPFPDWRVAPFFMVGAGMIKTQPNTTIVQSENRTNSGVHVGAGVMTYLTRRFVVRGEYRNYVVVMNTDNNQELEQWQLGIAFFF